MSRAARFADMADPDLNPQFRRRWHDPFTDEATGPDPRTPCAADPGAPLDQLANVFLADFRRGGPHGDG